MARIEYLINNPTEVRPEDLDLLNAEIEKYPYFYSLRALKLLALKNSNDSSFEENLSITAILSSSRKDLYNYIHNTSSTTNVAEEEIISTNSIQHPIVEETILDENLVTNDLIGETELSPEVETFDTEYESQQVIVQENILDENLLIDDLIGETELTPEVENFDTEAESQQEIGDNLDLTTFIENSLQVAEQFLQKDNEISNAVSETLDINSFVDVEPKIEQISLINRSITNNIDTETVSKPVSNINSFQVQNTYNVVKGSPSLTSSIENEVIDNIIETEEIIAEIESIPDTEVTEELIETKNGKTSPEITIENIQPIISENINSNLSTEELIVEEKQPTPTEETNDVVKKSTEIIETKAENSVEESVNKVDLIQTDDSFSFNDWLKLPSADTMETEKEQKYQIIDEFLEKNPKITPLKKQEIPESKSETKRSNETDFSYLMTETLAQVYIDQKQYEKAIRAYKILSLKYPEKNSLFANQIKEIENLKNSK